MSVLALGSLNPGQPHPRPPSQQHRYLSSSSTPSAICLSVKAGRTGCSGTTCQLPRAARSSVRRDAQGAVLASPNLSTPGVTLQLERGQAALPPSTAELFGEQGNWGSPCDIVSNRARRLQAVQSLWQRSLAAYAKLSQVLLCF